MLIKKDYAYYKNCRFKHKKVKKVALKNIIWYIGAAEGVP